MDSLTVFREIIRRNELGGDLSHAYRFSDPDGVRSGKSGWSFGLCQFDVANNPSAVLCLRECQFTTDEILGLKRQDVEMSPLNRKLSCSTRVVDRWDERQLFECLTHASKVCRASGIRFASDEVLFHLADYHNQFYLSRGGKMHQFLLGVGRPVTAQDILIFKLGLAWGKKRPDDVHRRFSNICNVWVENFA